MCKHEFVVESIVAKVVISADSPIDMGCACPRCVTYQGERNPDAHPTIEEYEAARRLYPEPFFSGVEEVFAAEDAESFELLAAAHKASWLTQG